MKLYLTEVEMTKTMRTISKTGRISFLMIGLVLLSVSSILAQSDINVIPREYRGVRNAIARGILDGNLVETNFRNHGELSRYDDRPHGVWPRGTGNRHIDGVGLMVGGAVMGERAKWPQFFGNSADSILNPVIINYRDAGRRVGPGGDLWGWLPLEGFNNRRRLNPFINSREPLPALSRFEDSWPEFWPDRLDNPDDPGWAGQWNGLFGKGVFNADLEAYYVIDDLADMEYGIDPENGLNYSPKGIFYPDPADSTRGGMGLQVKVRHLQWANVLAEDIVFMLYEIKNIGQYEHDGLYFAHIQDYGFGQEENDGQAEFDPQLDIAFGWDASGNGLDQGGRVYPIGYTGFAFLESPADPFDLLDNDEDGITDERRDSGPGQLIEGQDAIREYVEANYVFSSFERAFGPLEERRAYIAGKWWTGDENMNWVAYEDLDGNGRFDEGEPINNDVGRDGLGPNDLGYPGPDSGEADGIPTPGEPNFDALDIPESDQIGLTGFDLNTRPFYESGDNLRTDDWMWGRIMTSIFPLGTRPEAFIGDVEPFLLFTSGPVSLPPGNTDFLSIAWIFGSNRADFYRNRRTVQNIYDANYNFAQPPFTPTLTAIPRDGQVILAWDSLALRSFDRFTQDFDFEGFRLYKGTDPLLTDARVVTNVDGSPTFYRPIGQWDLINNISGTLPVLENTAVYNMGDNTGIEYFYVDDDVKNGKTYYYALVAYDRGVIDTLDGGAISVQIDPQENVFNFSVDAFSNLRGTSINASVVVPRAKAAGFIDGGAAEDLSRVTEGAGTGSIKVTVVDENELEDVNAYEVVFRDTTISPTEFQTTSYSIRNLQTNQMVLENQAMASSSPYVDGFFIEFFNDTIIEEFPERTGWVIHAGQENEAVNADPTLLDNIQTNWIGRVSREPDDIVPWEYNGDDFELRFFDEDVYFPPRFQTSIYIRDSINVVAYNKTKDREADLLILDTDDSGDFNAGDELIIAERIGVYRFRHRVVFNAASEQQVAPSAGDVFQIINKKPFKTGDLFRFTLTRSTTDTELAKDELERIAVVPNPYVATATWEPRNITQGRGDRRISFIHLPSTCTIEIYNLRGELIQRLEHQSSGSDGQVFWDLRNKDNQDVAYGVYIYHVSAPGIGEKTGKFALIK